MKSDQEVMVIKCNADGQEKWRYVGRVISKNDRLVIIESYFNRDDMLLDGVPFKRNDLFVEAYFTDKWYNIYEIYDQDTGDIKCWYCNLCRPAVITPETVQYDDLALDLFILADGTMLVLDIDEYDVLHLSNQEDLHVQTALAELKFLFGSPTQFRVRSLID